MQIRAAGRTRITSGPHSTSSMPRGNSALTNRPGLTGNLSSDGIWPTGPPTTAPGSSPNRRPSALAMGASGATRVALLGRAPDIQAVQAERVGQLLRYSATAAPPVVRRS
jgi:hypothetical protein